MGTTVKKGSKYYISKNRTLELRYFCRQYDEWKMKLSTLAYLPDKEDTKDPTASNALKRQWYKSRIELVERVTEMTDRYLAPWLLEGVTNEYSFDQLNARHAVPCGRTHYYKLSRKFFWLLDQMQVTLE